MRICYLADGESIHTRRWCQHFASLGHEVHLVTLKKTEIGGVTVHHIDIGPVSVQGGNWKVILKRGALKKILLQIKPDVLHAQYATSYGLLGAMSGFHPYVITALGTDVLISPQRSWLYRILVKYALRRADWVTAMAEHMRQTIIGLGINEKKVSTIIFGIDPFVFNPVGRSLPQHFTLISTRNLEPVYNIGLLIDAVGLVKAKIPGLKLQLIGQGTLREQLQEKVRALGLGDNVAFRGRIAQPEIANALRSSHLFISTSLSDGNNVSLNEAMACGAVSVATDIPANRQWIKEGVNGFLVPVDQPQALADKILYVYRNYPALQESALAYNAAIIAEKAVWTVNMQAVEQKYQELTGKK
jgi:glycosyltransferase involved in cell wall biosynthesis